MDKSRQLGNYVTFNSFMFGWMSLIMGKHFPEFIWISAFCAAVAIYAYIIIPNIKENKTL